MASTSEDPKGFDPMEQVTPFFNRAQLFAFSQAPSADALGRVNRGGSHDYLPQEYVRALLDRFIGPGRWAIRVSLVKTYEEKIQKNGKENNAVTAIVNVELDILSAIDPDKRLTYAGIGTHTMEAAADKGVAAVVGNAITSAESKGLKAAAKNLGKAFGSDLKNKLDRNALPPTIAQYAADLTERHARRTGTPRLVHSSAEPAAEAVEDGRQADQPSLTACPAAQREAERQQPAAEAVVEQPRQQEREAPAAGTQRQPARQASEQKAAEPKPAAKTVEQAPVERAKVEQATPAANQQDGAPQTEGATTEPAPAEDWEMSIMPSTYVEWRACMQTMQRRMQAMTSTREIENFIKRYNRTIISALPVYPQEGDLPVRDFKLRWKKVVGATYTRLGAPVPADYQIEPVAAAA